MAIRKPLPSMRAVRRNAILRARALNPAPPIAVGTAPVAAPVAGKPKKPNNSKKGA
jgi:hypothetical protein